MYQTKGCQVLLDFKWLENSLENSELLLTIFYILKESIEKTSLMIVEQSRVILPLPEYNSEIGGTIFFQLDSSHVSAHLYYETKLLVVDVFGCGTSDINRLGIEIEEKLRELIPSLKRTYKLTIPRFHY